MVPKKWFHANDSLNHVEFLVYGWCILDEEVDFGLDFVDGGNLLDGLLTEIE